MKKKVTLHHPLQCFSVLAGLAIVIWIASTQRTVPTYTVEAGQGKLYLYGEIHSEEKILEKELELWQEYYTNYGMRHLFIETSYSKAQLLNLWMQADNDEILDIVHEDGKGTQGYSQQAKSFYQQIKAQCPETVFHGTDVGHQYDTTGQRYLQYLKEQQLTETEEYRLAKENVEQGIRYYKKYDDIYRENKMVENLIREYEALADEDVMGIYGSAHTKVDARDYATNSIPCMANQLKQVYGERLYTEDLTYVMLEVEPIKVETMEVNGVTYEASYFGQQDTTAFSNRYLYREFWRLEHAYDDFKDCKRTWDYLPYNNYPMLIQEGQVFVIDYTTTDQKVDRLYYIAAGNEWKGQPTTEGIQVQ